MGQSDCV
ncbi:hypothetical protein MIMGU_mgv1a0180872mg, partial [Erythranthe guttata]